MQNSERNRTVSAYLRAKQQSLRRNMSSTRCIEAFSFSNFIAAQFERKGTLPKEPAYVAEDDKWKDDILRAIIRAPKNQATGAGDIFRLLTSRTKTRCTSGDCTLETQWKNRDNSNRFEDKAYFLSSKEITQQKSKIIARYRYYPTFARSWRKLSTGV